MGPSKRLASLSGPSDWPSGSPPRRQRKIPLRLRDGMNVSQEKEVPVNRGTLGTGGTGDVEVEDESSLSGDESLSGGSDAFSDGEKSHLRKQDQENDMEGGYVTPGGEGSAWGPVVGALHSDESVDALNRRRSHIASGFSGTQNFKIVRRLPPVSDFRAQEGARHVNPSVGMNARETRGSSADSDSVDELCRRPGGTSAFHSWPKHFMKHLPGLEPMEGPKYPRVEVQQRLPVDELCRRTGGATFGFQRRRWTITRKLSSSCPVASSSVDGLTRETVGGTQGVEFDISPTEGDEGPSSADTDVVNELCRRPGGTSGFHQRPMRVLRVLPAVDGHDSVGGRPAVQGTILGWEDQVESRRTKGGVKGGKFSKSGEEDTLCRRGTGIQAHHGVMRVTSRLPRSDAETTLKKIRLRTTRSDVEARPLLVRASSWPLPFSTQPEDRIGRLSRRRDTRHDGVFRVVGALTGKKSAAFQTSSRSSSSVALQSLSSSRRNIPASSGYQEMEQEGSNSDSMDEEDTFEGAAAIVRFLGGNLRRSNVDMLGGDDDDAEWEEEGVSERDEDALFALASMATQGANIANPRAENHTGGGRGHLQLLGPPSLLQGVVAMEVERGVQSPETGIWDSTLPPGDSLTEKGVVGDVSDKETQTEDVPMPSSCRDRTPIMDETKRKFSLVSAWSAVQGAWSCMRELQMAPWGLHGLTQVQRGLQECQLHIRELALELPMTECFRCHKTTRSLASFSCECGTTSVCIACACESLAMGSPLQYPDSECSHQQDAARVLMSQADLLHLSWDPMQDLLLTGGQAPMLVAMAAAPTSPNVWEVPDQLPLPFRPMQNSEQNKVAVRLSDCTLLDGILHVYLVYKWGQDTGLFLRSTRDVLVSTFGANEGSAIRFADQVLIQRVRPSLDLPTMAYLALVLQCMEYVLRSPFPELTALVEQFRQRCSAAAGTDVSEWGAWLVHETEKLVTMVSIQRGCDSATVSPDPPVRQLWIRCVLATDLWVCLRLVNVAIGNATCSEGGTTAPSLVAGLEDGSLQLDPGLLEVACPPPPQPQYSGEPLSWELELGRLLPSSEAQ